MAIFPPETPKMLANTKVLPALFNVPDEKLSQREKQWLFFRRKRQKCSPIQKYCLRFLTSPTKNYLNEKSSGYFSAGNAKNARQYKSIACAFQRPRRKTISTRKVVAIFPPETKKMLANTKVLPALFNVPDEKLLIMIAARLKFIKTFLL